MTKIKLSSSEIIMNEIVGVSNYSNLGTTPGSKICGINCSNTKSNQNEIMVFPFYDETDITTGLLIYHKIGNLYINKVLHTSYDEIFFLGSYNGAGTGNLMVLGILSLKLKALKILKFVSLDTDPEFILNPVDVIYSNNTFYILAESLVSYLSNYNRKIVLIKFDGTDIVWSAIYNSVAPIHSEAPSSFVMAPNGNLCIAGTIKRAGDVAPRMMLAQFDTDGNPVLMKTIELKSADSTYNNRYGWTYVQTKGINIHLLSQSIVGVSEPGNVLVTMFDSNFVLKTWRNYAVPIRVESAIIDGNFFLFSGQAPTDYGYEGFNLMKVNSLNAIVEKFKNFKPELKNSSIATSSASVYDRATDNIWTIAKPNGTSDNYIILLGNSSSLDNPCAENLSSQVAKDPMQLTDISLNVKFLPLKLSDIDGYVQEIDLTTKEICSITNSKELIQNQCAIYPNPTKSAFTITANKLISKIEIYNSLGLNYYSNYSNQLSFKVDYQLPAGLYFIHITFKDKTILVRKVIVD